MIQKFDPEIHAVIEKISRAIPKGVSAYLVGGAIRNLLLGLPVEDLDFVIDGSVKHSVRQVKQALSAKAFFLDDVRQMSRVICQTQQGKTLHIDFATLSGGSIEADLQSRDFTINAIALDLQHANEWVDPLGGIPDLNTKTLSCCSAQSMVLDPLRILRGVRFVAEHNLKIDPASYLLMKQEVPMLVDISGERVRDELFKFLQGRDPIKALALMDDLGCFEFIMTPVGDLAKVPAYPPHISPLKKHTLRAVEILHKLINNLIRYEPDGNSDFINRVMETLQPYRAAYQQHFATEFPDQRTRKGLMMFGTLLHDIGKPETITQESSGKVHYYGHPEASLDLVVPLAKSLGLSNRECDYLACYVSHHMRIHQLANTTIAVTDRAVFRFFRDTSDVGLDLCLFSLADLAATYEATLPEDLLACELDVIVRLLDGWIKRKQIVVSPQKLLDGNDIMRMFDLTPGPIFSQILTALQEAQAAGEVMNEADAMQFVSNFLKKFL